MKATRILSSLALSVTLALGASACAQEAGQENERVQSEGVGSVTTDSGLERPDFRALEAKMAADPASVTAPEAMAIVGGADKFRSQFPKGTRFTVEDDSWEKLGQRGAGMALMGVDLPEGSDKMDYQVKVVLLQDVNYVWWVVQTLDPES